MRTILLFLFLCATAQAQIKVDKVYAQYQPIIIECGAVLPENTKQQIIWDLSSKNKVSFREFNQALAVWAEPGTYNVEATVLLTTTKKIGDEVVEILVPGGFKKYRAEFKVLGSGPTPDPVPDPTPDPVPPPKPVPPKVDPDQFDNIGQRVFEWVPKSPPEAYDARLKMALLYNDLYAGLESGKYLSLDIAYANFNANKAAVMTSAISPHWASFGKNLVEDINKRSLNRTQAIDYYKAVEKGLK